MRARLSSLRRSLFALMALALSPLAGAVLLCTPTVSDINLGLISPDSSATYSASGSVRIDCSGGAANSTVHTCLPLGATDIIGSSRELVGTNGKIPYNLFIDAEHTQIWGGLNTLIRYMPPVYSLGLDQQGGASLTVPMYAFAPKPPAATPSGSYVDLQRVNDVMLKFAASLGGTTPDCETLHSPNPQYTQFAVAANVDPQCRASATDLDFGVADDLNYGNTPLYTTSNIVVTCVSGVDYKIHIDGGTGLYASMNYRLMTHRTGGPDTVNYQIYTDPAHTQIWGNGNAGTSERSGVGNGNPTSFTVYGKVDGQSTPQAGGYIDTLIVLVVY